MKKLAALSILVFLVSGFSAASTNYDGPNDEPHIMQQPNDIPVDTDNRSIVLPDLPESASDTASQVLSTINDAFSNGVQNIGERLGNLLG